MRNYLVIVVIVIGSVVLSFNHNMSLMHLRTMNGEIQQFATEALRLANSEFARSESLEFAKQQSDTLADGLASSNDSLNEMIHEQGVYIDTLLDTLEFHGILPPPYEGASELFEQNPLLKTEPGT